MTMRYAHLVKSHLEQARQHNPLAKLPREEFSWKPERDQPGIVGQVAKKKRIGAAKGVFDVPDTVDAKNVEVAALFSGPAEQKSTNSH
jgi:hypothetical protein